MAAENFAWGDNALVKQAYREISGGKDLDYSVKVQYSGKFSDYNANVKYGRGRMQFGLSNSWKEVSDEIKVGLFQSLLKKIFHLKAETINIDLYNKFLKNVHIAAPKTESAPVLGESFDRINEKMFNGMIDRTNFRWGESGRLLGRYEYGSDTIMISKALKEDYELLDYVMHHEMLHKKHKYNYKNGRSTHHSHAFRAEEKAYPNSDVMEARLKRVVSAYKVGKKAFPRPFRLRFW